jgi:tetratricopeptide (TPR) repeat protein
MRAGPRIPLSQGEAKVKEALEANPRSPLAWIANARLAFNQAYVQEGEYNLARLALSRKHLDHAATLGPKGAEWWMFAVWLCRAEKQPQAAREAVREAHALAPNDPSLVLGEAELDFADEQYAKVIATVSRLIGEKPLGEMLRGAYNVLLKSYRELGDIDAADTVHRRLIALDPKAAFAHGNYSDFLLEDAGDATRAIAEARAALALMDYGNGRGNLANALTERGNARLWDGTDTKEALHDFEEAIRVYPDVTDAYYGRAAVLRQRAVLDHDLRGIKQARADLQRVLATFPKWVGAQRALADLDTLEASARKK